MLLKGKQTRVQILFAFFHCLDFGTPFKRQTVTNVIKVSLASTFLCRNKLVRLTMPNIFMLPQFCLWVKIREHTRLSGAVQVLPSCPSRKDQTRVERFQGQTRQLTTSNNKNAEKLFLQVLFILGCTNFDEYLCLLCYKGFQVF